MLRLARPLTRRVLGAAALAPTFLAAGLTPAAAVRDAPISGAPAVRAAAVPAAAPAAVTLRADILAQGFVQPVAVASPRDGRLFVVEKAGTIQAVDQLTGERLGQYADLRARIDPAGEQGLLGMAFDPAFRTGRPFVYLAFVSNQEQALRVVRFRPTGDDPAAATLNPATTEQVISVPHPTNADNHYAGTVAFGPDGLLYVSTGDGGTTPQAAQNLFSLSGKVLRIDPRRREVGRPYAIPPGNPFRYGRYGRPEIWLWGLRNPYRFSIDFATGTAWVADVGQDAMEEISTRYVYASGGGNLGWDCREGTIAYPYRRSACPGPGPQVGPRIAYGRGFGESVTGGYVYRGSDYPQLRGLYVFADFISGRVVLHDPAGPVGNLTQKLELPQVTGFGEGERRELFLVTIDGSLRQVTAA